MTVAAIYKERWQIELLFKALKQNLRIKTFVGTSANALKTQIWTALVSHDLLTILQAFADTQFQVVPTVAKRLERALRKSGRREWELTIKLMGLDV